MGAPVSKLEAAEPKTAEALLSAFKHMSGPERRKHATVFNYWLSIRRDADLPPIRDLDPLEISDAAPYGVLVELINAGEDGEILHLGEVLRDGVAAKKLSQVPGPSALSCIAGKLGIVAISRDALAFEDTFQGADGTTRCCVTLLPFSMAGDAVDFVYGLISVETGVTEVEETAEPPADSAEPIAEAAPEAAETAEEKIQKDPIAPTESEPEVLETPEPVTDEVPPEDAAEPESTPDEIDLPQFLTAPQPTVEPETKPGFSKIFDALAGAKGFFGTVASADSDPAPKEPESGAEGPAPTEEDSAQVEEEPTVAEEPAVGEGETVPFAEEPAAAEEEATPVAEASAASEEEATPVAEESVAADELGPTAEDPTPAAEEKTTAPVPMEGTLQSKLTEVRSKADEAKAAKLRSEALLLEGLSAAYDFALDAENAPEEYLKLVEAQGLKIQLRSPMKPVVKLAFDGYCDDETIKQLEGVMSWALKMELPRGSLAERIEAEGGLTAVLGGQKRAA